MKKVLLKAVGVLVLIATLLPCVGCRNKAPELDEIYDRAVELVTDARELNNIFYGSGLPTYDKNSVLYQDIYDNDTSAYKSEYSIVVERCEYRSVEELKEKAETVWSAELLEEQVYPMAFDGLTATVGTITSVSPARFQEDNGNFYCLDGLENLKALIFDFSTMKIVNPSNATRVFITLDAREEGTEESFSYRLVLTKENGVWLLDKLTV